jgi:hypothetical protein
MSTTPFIQAEIQSEERNGLNNYIVKVAVPIVLVEIMSHWTIIYEEEKERELRLPHRILLTLSRRRDGIPSRIFADF